jgi:mono/diheme cytochrome c family protein
MIGRFLSPERSSALAAALAVGALAAFALAPAARAQPPLDGANLFKQNCSACHQDHGQGMKGAFPALAGDTFVQGDKKTVASLLLHGRGGMPNFSDDLSDAEISAILTFVRSSWGNSAPPVDIATVATARAEAGALQEAHSGTTH